MNHLRPIKQLPSHEVENMPPYIGNQYLWKNDNNLSSELANLNNLLKDGVLTQEEFDKAKKKILDN